MDCIVQGVTKSQTRLNDSHFHPTPQHTHPTPSFSPFSFVLGHCGLWRRQDTKCSPDSSGVPGVCGGGVSWGGWGHLSSCCLIFSVAWVGRGLSWGGWGHLSSRCSFILFPLLPKPLLSVECLSRHLVLRLKGLLTFLVRHQKKGLLLAVNFIYLCAWEHLKWFSGVKRQW